MRFTHTNPALPAGRLKKEGACIRSLNFGIIT